MRDRPHLKEGRKDKSWWSDSLSTCPTGHKRATGFVRRHCTWWEGGAVPSEAIEDLGSKGCGWAPQSPHLLTWVALSLRHLSNRTEHMWYIHMAGAFSCSVLGSEVSSSWSKFYLCFLQNRVPWAGTFRLCASVWTITTGPPCGLRGLRDDSRDEVQALSHST